jgi:hypothetical protein
MKASVSAEGVRDGSVVLILSHDLDTYTMLPLTQRRDFMIKTMRHWFIEEEQGGKLKSIYAGIQFQEFLGRKVRGYYAPMSSIIASGVLDVESLEELKGLTIIQMVPDFHQYRSMARVLGAIHALKDLEAKALFTDDALAQTVAEDTLLNTIGLFYAMPRIANNPFPPTTAFKNVQAEARNSKALNRQDEIWKFFREAKISYAVTKVGDNFIGIGQKTIKPLG